MHGCKRPNIVCHALERILHQELLIKPRASNAPRDPAQVMKTLMKKESQRIVFKQYSRSRMHLQWTDCRQTNDWVPHWWQIWFTPLFWRRRNGLLFVWGNLCDKLPSCWCSAKMRVSSISSSQTTPMGWAASRSSTTTSTYDRWYKPQFLCNLIMWNRIWCSHQLHSLHSLWWAKQWLVLRSELCFSSWRIVVCSQVKACKKYHKIQFIKACVHCIRVLYYPRFDFLLFLLFDHSQWHANTDKFSDAYSMTS